MLIFCGSLFGILTVKEVPWSDVECTSDFMLLNPRLLAGGWAVDVTVEWDVGVTVVGKSKAGEWFLSCVLPLNKQTKYPGLM